jgi:hypothetical protein
VHQDLEACIPQDASSIGLPCSRQCTRGNQLHGGSGAVRISHLQDLHCRADRATYGRVSGPLTVRHPSSSSLSGSLSAGLRDVDLVPPPVARTFLRIDFWTQPRHIQQHRFTIDGIAGSVAPVCDTHATEVDTGSSPGPGQGAFKSKYVRVGPSR